MDTPILNEHNKEEYPPMHTAEHILNGTMVKMFGCRRAQNAHIERRKSKCDYDLPAPPSGYRESSVSTKRLQSQLNKYILKSATKPFNVLLACTCPLLLN